MKHAWGSRAIIVALVGVMVLSAGLVLLTDSALAGKDDRGDKDHGSATDLSGVTQNWDKTLTGTARFTVLAAFGGAAVRDNNTGLVWEQAPSATQDSQLASAVHCINGVTVGDTKGWRLPSVVELSSLVDPTSTAAVRLPAGNPFSNVQLTFYWSATTVALDPALAWVANFSNGVVGNGIGKGNPGLAWCVRGPMNADQY